MSCGCQDKNNQMNNQTNNQVTNVQDRNMNMQQNIQLKSPLSIENMLSQNMSLDQAIYLYEQGYRIDTVNTVPMSSLMIPNIQQNIQPSFEQLQSPQIKSLATNDDPSILLAFIIGVAATLTALFIAKKWIKF